MKRRAGRAVDHPGFAFVVLTVVLLVGVYVKSHEDSVRLRSNAVASCERGKLDRVELVKAFRSMSIYYGGVTRAESVKPDVKRIAGLVRDRLDGASDGLTERILLCRPLVDDGSSVPDRSALRSLPPRR